MLCTSAADRYDPAAEVCILNERVRGRADELSDSWAVIAVAALATVLMLESARVFVSYLIFVIDQSRRLEIAAVVLLVFVSPALTPLLVRAAGPRRAVLLAAVALALLRIAVQFTDTPALRLGAGGAAIVAWGALLICLLASRRLEAGFGALLGLGLDTAIRTAFGDLDLPWLPRTSSNLVTLGPAALLIAAALYLPKLRAAGAKPRLASVPILVIGPALALQHLALGNAGIVQVRAGLDYPAAALALALGSLIGGLVLYLCVFGPLRPATRRSAMTWFSGSALTSGLTLWLWLGVSNASGELVQAAWVVAAVSSTVLMLGQALAAAPVATAGSVGPATLWLTAGLVVQFAVLFIYYSQTGRLLLIAIAWLIAAGCGALAAWTFVPAAAPRPMPRLRLAAPAWGAIMLLPSLLWVLVWSVPAGGPPAGATFTVMTYNIQSGFSLTDDWDLEEQARVIESFDPDVVVLQEVSRGWLVTTGSDELLWLSRRLDMPYVWGPASDDGLWGNAILSRAPLSNAAELHYSSTQNFQRSAIRAQVETDAGPVWIFATHLDNPTGAGAVRFEQVEQLLEFWGGREPAVLMGDFNAVAGDDVIMRVVSAGFVDHGATVTPEATTSQDDRRIDYIFTAGDLTLVEIQTPAVTASDHRPVVATLTHGP